MPIINTWKDAEKTILYVEFLGDWTWDDYHNSMEAAHAMVAEIDHHFVQLIDMRNAKPMPATSRPVPQIMRGRKQESQNQGITVIVGAEAFVRIIVNVFDKTREQSNLKRYLVESMDEGLALIAQYFAERAVTE